MKAKVSNQITIGLFGTCGNSKWRDSFIQKFEESNIAYFNPLVPDWIEEYAGIEAEHLVEDEIILFPVTDETFGFGSLAETGYSISQALRSNSEKFVVIFIAPDVNEFLWTIDPVQAKESKKARSLAMAHVKRQAKLFPNVYIVDSMESMKTITFMLYAAMFSLKKAREFCSL
jgi:hypothetical protein